MSDYCDTNMITASVNRNELTRAGGSYGFNKFSSKITRVESPTAIEKSRKITKCVSSRGVIFNDIGKHEPSLGAVLTFSGLKKLELVDVKGMKTGKRLFNEACGKGGDTHFHKKFCKNNQLRKDLDFNKLNDIQHFGSAVELKSDRFLTDNIKDFKPLEGVSDIKIE
ncbi:MAG: hypothetical protein KKC77_19410 [Proteobacteria bacterium]|nr:hypothetical protein [Pseudomonadota bacterium]